MSAKTTQLVSGFRVSKDTDAEGESTVLGHNRLDMGGQSIVVSSGAVALSAPITLTSTTVPQHTVAYDGSNLLETSVSAAGDVSLDITGDLTVTPTGGNTNITGNITVEEGNLRIQPTTTVSANLAFGTFPSISSYSEDAVPGFGTALCSSTDTPTQCIQHFIGRSRGTAAAPTDVVAGDLLYEKKVMLYEGSALHDTAVEVFAVPAGATIDATSHPCEYSFSTCAIGEIIPVERFAVTGAGTVTVAGDPINAQYSRAGCTTTGLDGNPTVDVTWHRCGKIISLFIPSITDTQNGGGGAFVTIDLTGGAATEVVPLPATIVSGVTGAGGLVQDNSVYSITSYTFSGAGVITLGTSTNTAFSGAVAGITFSQFIITYITT